ncbi:aspartic-type endopeptidase [Moniliophthora roreri MCA 2997]|uniref:Aspartic-type endopeptidase n=1 Tax=Moniliophthora roreri (strain MCA 2997) TaxID=1381753 RepID=V2X929_MONRO|nr:aspartic-type endopeptidase [Moniliophthora roreri MCA 2997]
MAPSLRIKVISYLLFLPCLVASATSNRRQDPSLPSTVFIPLKLNSNQRYLVQIHVSSQPFTFALSTSTGYSVIAGTDCLTCNVGSTLDISPTSALGFQNLSIFAGFADGTIVQEDCQLEKNDGAAWNWTNQRLIAANQSNLFSPQVSGILGLGDNGRDRNFEATVLGNWLSKNPTQANVSYGLALNAPLEASEDGGEFHWLRPNNASFEEPVVWKPLIPANTSTTQYDSFVQMDTYSFDGEGASISGPLDLLAVIDPFTSSIFFPQDQARAIYGAIPGSSPHLTLSTSTAYSVPCDAKMKLTLVFGELSVSLDERKLVRRAQDTCYGTIEEWASPSANEYLLGSTFVSSIYLIYQGSSSSSSYGFANRKEPISELTLLAIIGIGMGVIGFVLAIIIATYLITRSYLKRRLSNKSITYEPFDLYRHLTNPDSDPFIPRPFLPSPSPSPPPLPDWWSTSHISMPPTPSPNSAPVPNATRHSKTSSAQYAARPRRPSEASDIPNWAQVDGLSSPLLQQTGSSNEARALFIQLHPSSSTHHGTSTFYTLTLPVSPMTLSHSHSNSNSHEDGTSPPPYLENEIPRH